MNGLYMLMENPKIKWMIFGSPSEKETCQMDPDGR